MGDVLEQHIAIRTYFCVRGNERLVSSGFMLVRNKDLVLFQHKTDGKGFNVSVIPMSELESRWSEIPKEGPVYIYCRSGPRSRTAIQFLKSKGYSNCVNLTGGILSWLNEVNPEGRAA